jgi:hypothetical protein
MSKFEGLPPRKPGENPDILKAGFINYQGHELYLTWLIPFPKKLEYQKSVEKICCEAAMKHGILP